MPDRGALGGFVNYGLLGTHDTAGNIGSASIELGAFNSFGAINSTGVAVAGEGQHKYTRLDTTWTYPMPERLTTVRAGDIVSRPGAWGRSLRYGGVQYGTDFTLQPNLVLLPGQAIAGAAAVPSTVDVFVNNALVAQQQVRPGPFSIGNVPPITGTGDLTLVVRDELGREQVISRPFYASASLLRAGLSDFTYEAGYLRENYGVSSDDYGPWFARRLIGAA